MCYFFVVKYILKWYNTLKAGELNMKSLLKCNKEQLLTDFIDGYEYKSEAGRDIGITPQLLRHYELDSIQNPDKYVVLSCEGSPSYFIEIKKVL
jgi:hypothetical protein